MSSENDGAVSVVVIAYNDAEHVAEAVASALAQGDVVGEVVVVDDASTDETAHVLGQLAAAEPRVRVVRRAVNSGGCGTPRNDGIDAARHPWLVFLDSDDVLPPKAVDTLLAVALRHGADVTAGLCVRRELPGGREIPWQEQLFTTESVHDGVAGRPQTLWDTLSVNKIYRRDFLLSRRIRFPDGAAHYEDFVFTARVYAAGPRFAVTPETVYIWHVRYGTGRASISLRRDRIQNWQDRVTAHQQVMEIMRDSGDQDLLIAAQTKFLEFDLAVYLSELPQRTPEYQDVWWRITREHVGAFEAEAVRRATLAARWRTEVLLGRERHAVDIRRLAELAADPPRLTPPYAGDARRPLWDMADSTPEGTGEIVLDGLADAPVALLPFYVLGNVGAGRRLVLELRLADLYGRTAHAGPERATVELRHRVTGAAHRYEAEWEAEPDGHGWRAVITADVAPLCEGGTITTWDAWVTLTFRDGESATRPLRAGSGLRRLVRMGRRGRVLLLQPYATNSGCLAVRVADGLSGVRRVVAGRVARRVRS
ncbi:glycosyltransferase family 2 protein [Streptomyces camelliae]|uniref:Glycosyltransferase n=1 Tax=Streptomyces camelliae TaxID=3004093 RepID=A0ABY7PDP1_9ACTN|nr:glycosyltransferase family 2 protein [Streptomyces sp. HUAS 2-6]WBO68739.1 glycosyltransferase [Streptomyces sp. HUAS 2-6]